MFDQAESGGQGLVSRRSTGQAGSEQFVMKIPNNKVKGLEASVHCDLYAVCFKMTCNIYLIFQVGLVIGKGGETIKNMQARTGARIQVCFKFDKPSQSRLFTLLSNV